MRAFVIGLVAGLVILVAVGLLPRLLRSSAQVNAAQALLQAEVARRQVHNYDPRLEDLEAHSDLKELKQSDLGAAQRSDIQGFEELLRYNRNLLEDAKRNAQQAVQQARDTVGAVEPMGMVHYVQASGRLADAQRLQTELNAALIQARLNLARRVEQQAQVDHYAAIDTSNTLEQLREDLRGLNGLRSEAQAQADELAEQIRQREQRLGELRGQLEHGKNELLTLEQMGFTPGDDQSFAQYSSRYREFADRMAQLQAQEQLLQDGGLRGATVADEELVQGSITGGEPVIGLTELRRRLIVANDNVERYTAGESALEDQIATVEAFGQSAVEIRQKSEEQLASIQRELEANRVEIRDVLEQWMTTLDTALSVARQAVQAFQTAQRAVRAWKDEARELRSLDTQGVNERLKLIVQDRIAETDASTSIAQANTLLGRIHAERVTLLEQALPTLEALEPEVDLDALRTALETGRENAIDALDQARDVYEQVVREGGNTAWIYQAALATVEHLLARVDSTRAEEHINNALDLLREVVEKAGKSPHAQAYVRMYEHLRRVGE